jgi:hypothetical protein
MKAVTLAIRTRLRFGENVFQLLARPLGKVGKALTALMHVGRVRLESLRWEKAN